MKPWLGELVRGGVGFVVGLIDRAIARRRAKSLGATAVLEEHGELQASKARQRAHEALERRREP